MLFCSPASLSTTTLLLLLLVARGGERNPWPRPPGASEAKKTKRGEKGQSERPT